MNELSAIQKFFKRFASEATFADMESESRKWMVKCTACNHERSVWEMGGIRWKAAGNNKRLYRPCPNCHQRSWHTVNKK